MQIPKKGNDSIWLGLAAGALGGLAGAFAMNVFQSLLGKAQEALSPDSSSPQGSGGESGEDATVKTAQAIASVVCHETLTEEQKKWAGPAVHYTFGTIMGATYGALAVACPIVQAGRGSLFGAALWSGADEVAVPAFGLSKPPSETALSSHASALAAHLVYGLTADSIHRFITHSVD